MQRQRVKETGESESESEEHAQVTGCTLSPERTYATLHTPLFI